jgi:Na+(H+)/acetate symporter ActP
MLLSSFCHQVKMIATISLARSCLEPAIPLLVFYKKVTPGGLWTAYNFNFLKHFKLVE